MRKLVLVMAAALVACGSSNNPSSAVSGTIGGAAFTPSDIKALVAAPTTCASLQPYSLSAGATAIAFSSSAGFCSDISNPACPAHANARIVTVFVANVTAPAGTTTPPGIAPGTYTIDPASAAIIPPFTNRQVGLASALSTNASCAGTPVQATGSLRIDELQPQVKGHVDLTFTDGGKLVGDFAADLCSGIDTCTAVGVQLRCNGAAAGACI